MVDQSIPRRKFTKLVGATAAVGAAAGCMHNEGEGPAEPGDEPGADDDDLDEEDDGLGDEDNESEDDGLGDEDNESEDDGLGDEDNETEEDN